MAKDRANHFTDTAENTFRTIGMMTPTQMAAQEAINKKRYDKLLAEQQRAERPAKRRAK